MVATLLDLVVPGFGAVGEVLVKIKEICVKIHDSKNACKRISMQLHDIFDEIVKLESRQRVPSTCSKAITKYVGVLMEFTEFLERHQDKRGLEKLKERCKLPSKLERIQSDVEMLFRMLNLGTADMVASLKLRFEDEQREQRRELAKLSADTSIIRKEVLGYRETMHEILSLLYSYQNSQGAAKKHLHDELSRTLTNLQMSNSKSQSQEMQMIETQIFSALSETPLPRKLDLPEWFLPDTEVTYEPKPCSRASFGSLHLGACNGTDVVVMCLNDGTGESLQTNEKFQRCITRWHGLDHPHVAKMLGVSHLSSPPLVIYEEVKYNMAGYLADSTNAGSMWRLLYETALGLRYAHNKKVLHGNLKLTTIRVDSEGHAKICGLGAVARISSRPSRLKSGAVRWQAPECLTGRRTFASDIYSLAMCIIEAVSGEPPFGQLDDDTVRDRLLRGEIPDKPSNMSAETYTLVAEMTVADLDKRLSLARVVVRLMDFMSSEEKTCNDSKSPRMVNVEQQDGAIDPWQNESLVHQLYATHESVYSSLKLHYDE